MGFGLFDRIQARIERFRLGQRYTRRSTHQPTVFATASYADLPEPPRTLDIEAARPSSAGGPLRTPAPVLPPILGVDKNVRPDSRGLLSPTWIPSAPADPDGSIPSARPKRASRWSVMPSLTQGSRTSALESSDYDHDSEKEDQTVADTKRNRRKTMMQRMSVLHENPAWRETTTQEQMQDWRIHAMAVQ